MNKKNKNLLFIIFIAILLCIAGIANLYTSPYGFIKKEYYMDLANKDKRFLPVYVYNHKEQKHEVLFTGNSDAATLFNNFDISKHFFNSVMIDIASIKELYKMLEYYLELHPETKKAYWFVSYESVFLKKDEGEINTEEMPVKRYIEIMLSLDNLKNNIKKLLSLLCQRAEASDADVSFTYYPFNIEGFTFFNSYNKKCTKENLIYLVKILELFKEKNIELTVLIPPYNMIYTSMIYLNDDFYKTAEDVKRIIVNTGMPVYDFSVKNQYTCQNLLNGENFLYNDPKHANNFFGYKILKNLLFPEYSQDENLYVKLTKENLEENLLKQRQEIFDFIFENIEYIEQYKTAPKSLYSKKFSLSDVSAEFNDDRMFLEEKKQEKDINTNEP